MKILITGATGYIGGRLIGRLLDRGHEIRVLVRDPRRLAGRDWAGKVEVFVGDLMAPSTLEGLCQGVDVAYYLVHSMYGGGDFASQDLVAVRNFIAAAQGLPHVIYLGGILPASIEETRSEHLRSRAEVGVLLREALPTTEIRAGPIIGSGSASFEMVRYLTERLPAMVAPRWILHKVRPVSVRNVLLYLIAVAERAEPLGVMDVGGELITFRDMMLQYGEVRGFRRWIIPVPVLTPKLSGLWVGLVTPIPNEIALPLVEGVIQPVVGDVSRSRALFPEIQPLPYRQAVALALERVTSGVVTTRWSGALGVSETSEFEDREGLLREVRTLRVEAPPEAVFRAFSSLGGDQGWLYWDWAWSLRGLLDQVVGGPGTRRGRRHPTDLQPGEVLDFWRVEAIVPGKLLRLRAEMKVPGRAWLQWEAIPEESGTRLIQSAVFEPAGLGGFLYWYSVSPFHGFIFPGMARAVARLAESRIEQERLQSEHGVPA